LRDLVTHLYYWEDHDLIVNTDSMYRGVKRQEPPYYFFDRGPNVNHFQYFTNPKTRDLLINWLTFDKTRLKESGFKVLTEANLALERTAGRGAAPDNAPVLFFIPGFMDTHLADMEGPVWLDFDVLALRGAERLAKLNTPRELLGPPYQAIIDFLQNSLHVIQFPYDWTLSAVANGEKLADLMEAEFQKPQRPVHLLSHSTGSFVVQALPESAWGKLTARGGRWVQLGGTPDGTHSAVAMITGQAAIVRQLQLLDYAHREQIRALFASWPGLLEMLPAAFFEDGKWDGFTARPDSSRLRAASEAREKLVKRDSLYVAGRSARTPGCSEGKLTYSNTGDGRVLQDNLPKNKIFGTWMRRMETSLVMRRHSQASLSCCRRETLIICSAGRRRRTAARLKRMGRFCSRKSPI
jgi:hypothetical protein